MKEIINGKRYDTDTATFIAEWNNSYPVNDFNHQRETIYQTEKGTYFLFGIGGPMSEYSRWSGNAVTGDSQIIPLTKRGVFDWMCKCEYYDLAEMKFPQLVEDA